MRHLLPSFLRGRLFLFLYNIANKNQRRLDNYSRMRNKETFQHFFNKKFGRLYRLSLWKNSPDMTVVIVWVFEVIETFLWEEKVHEQFFQTIFQSFHASIWYGTVPYSVIEMSIFLRLCRKIITIRASFRIVWEFIIFDIWRGKNDLRRNNLLWDMYGLWIRTYFLSWKTVHVSNL